MVTKKSTEGVGKKIVEALKKQADPTFEERGNNFSESDLEEYSQPESDIEESDMSENNIENMFDEENIIQQMPQQDSIQQIDTSFLNNSFISEPDPQQYYQQPQQSYNTNTDVKTENVKVLGNLINQLPAGISKQTGAIIIKQTMEALGISMKQVLGEAQQIQEKLSLSTNECLNTIQDCKRQIQTMEKQVQIYHKQYNSLNELISLFVQTGI